jgi:hypothetical protein
MNLKNISKTSKAYLIWVLAFVTTLLFSVGCSNKDLQSTAKALSVKDFNQRDNELFAPYFTGNVEEARQSLKRTIQHLEESNVLDSHSQAGILSVNYFRLYVLEARSGNKSAAEVALAKARYWKIRIMELEKRSENEIVDELASLKPERIMKDVDDFDKGANHELGPKYLQYITN